MGPQVIVPSGEEIREVGGVWQEALNAEYLLWLPRKEFLSLISRFPSYVSEMELPKAGPFV